MTTFTSIPKEIEAVLEQRSPTTSRREFLKTSGLLVVSFSAAAVTGAGPRAGGDAAGVVVQAAARIPTQTSDNSIRGSSFMETTRRPSTSARPIVARVRAQHFGR